MRNPALHCLTLVVSLSWAASSAAQSKEAAAEALFAEGRAAMSAQDYTTACARFRESNRLDPAAGTVMNLARCEEARGRLATAWELYRRALDELPQSDDRRPVAREHAQALASRLPKLTLRIGKGAPEAMTVRVGELQLGAGSLGIALPLDPGKHEVQVTAPARRTRTFAVELAEREHKELELFPGEQVSSEAAPASTAGSWRPAAGWIAGGVGVAGLVVGSVTGVMALNRKETVDDNCTADKLCSPAGTEAAESGKTLSRWSTAGFLVGAAGAGLGAYLLLSGTSDGAGSAVSIAASHGGARLGWEGTW
jgi:tetratricopeptide (TPR) repeat protein